MNVVIRATDNDDNARNVILEALVAYNDQKTGESDYQQIVLAVHDERGNAVGGLSGRTEYGWLFVELLFVPASLRGQGVGTELMRRAEAEAVARGCHSSWLDTFEFQARRFYERLGYTCFGELPHYPTGPRFFMSKALKK